MQGEPSVFDSETARAGLEEPVGRRTSRQIAGTDYQHAETCQVQPLISKQNSILTSRW